MKIQRVLAATAVAAVAAFALGSAHANQTWAFSYTGAGVSASGSFVTAGTALVAEDILSISGQRNGLAITGLVPLDTDPDFLYDNQFVASEPHFTDGGMVFSVAGGQPNVNVYFFAGTYTDLFIDGLDPIDTPITFNVTAVPEPATVLSMMAGLGLIGALRLRSRRA